MGLVNRDEALAKGPVVRALDEMSTRPNARELLKALLYELKAAAVYPTASDGTPDNRRPDFPTLTTVLKQKLLFYWSEMNPGGVLDPSKLEGLAKYLDTFWFGPKPLEYARFETRAIYGVGLIKAIDSSLRGSSDPKPIDAYWFINCDRLQLITLESKYQVTLMIATPVPVSDRYMGSAPGGRCDSYVTVATDKNVDYEISPLDSDPLTAITAVNRSGYRICTYKIGGQ